MQTASAFSSVQGALSFFITVYRTLAEWQAVVNRLDGFEAGIAAARDLATRDDRVHVVETAGAGAIDLKGLALRLPNGTPLVNADGFSLRKGERTLVTGPSGSGKSTLFRAIAGIWPFGAGSIAVPAGATLMMLPQRPYFPTGSLRGAIEYPAKDGTFTDSQISDVLESVGLPKLASQPGRRSALESHALARRTAAPRAGARAVARAELPVPRRGDRLARRTLGGRAVPPACGEVAGNHHRLDRPPLDAGRLPSAQCQPGARRRSLRAEGRQAGVGSVGRVAASGSTASAAAMAGGAPRGARHSRTRSKAARRPAPAPAGTSMADCLIPPAAG